MASATDLVSNSGNANLGYGGSNDIPIVSKPENSGFNKMQDVANRMMLQNHAFNKSMFDQKIADRDAALAALDKGQVQSGRIEADDRPAYDAARKKQDDAFTYFAENGGVNNKEAYQKWIDATTELKNLATHLQGREIEISKQKAEMGAEPIKAKQEARKLYLDKQLAKGSNAMIDPYQQSLDFDTEELQKEILDGSISGSGVSPMTTVSSTRVTQQKGKPDKVTTFSKTVPLKGAKGTTPITTTVTGEQTPTGGAVQSENIVYKNGLPYKVSSTFVDFNKIKQNANEKYLNNTAKVAEYVDQLYDKFTDPNYLSHPEVIDTYDAMVKAAIDYNKARGYVMDAQYNVSPEDIQAGAADVKKLINGFNAPLDPQTGKRQINLTKPELAAYFTLASVPNFTSRSETLLKDEAELGLKDKKISGELKLKAQEAASKAALRNAQIKKIKKSIEGKSEKEQKMEFDKYWAANGVSVLSDKTGNIPYKNSRPVYIQNDKGEPKLLKPIAGVAIYDKYDGSGAPAKGAVVIGYDGGHYKTEFYSKSTGQSIGVDKIKEGFQKAKANNPSLSEQDYLFNLGDNGITYRMIGEGGKAANVDDNGNNLRVLDNRFKKKDQDDPYFSDAELFQDETTTTE